MWHSYKEKFKKDTKLPITQSRKDQGAERTRDLLEMKPQCQHKKNSPIGLLFCPNRLNFSLMYLTNYIQCFLDELRI